MYFTKCTEDKVLNMVCIKYQCYWWILYYNRTRFR
jgi:hypothetical protein